MAVTVAAGRAWIPGGNVTNISGFNFSTQGNYFALNDAAVTLTVAAADPTNPRIDSAYAAVNDSFYSGGTNTAVLGVVTGTPAPSPVAPTIPTNAVLLATLAVAANATTIVNANITGAATQVYAVASSSPSYIELGSSTAQITASATFTQLTAFASISGAGAGFSSGGSNVTVTTAGRYRATGIVVYGANATGTRVANVSSTPGSQSPVASVNVGAGNGTSTSVEVSYILTVPAGGTIALWGYQNSGVVLNVILTRLYVPPARTRSPCRTCQ